jgi:hypothetical protein
MECPCGKAYWPSQAWIHKGCASNKVVVDTPKPAALVVDAVANVVVDRKRDRHAKTDARKEYLRLKQRESRARRAAA